LTRRRFGLGVVSLIGSVAVAGCGDRESEGGGDGPKMPGEGTASPPAGVPSEGGKSAGAGEKKKVVYAIIPKMLNNPFFDVAHHGASKAEKDLEAADASLDVQVEYQSSETGKPDEQVEVIRKMVQRKVDGLAISVIDENAVREIIDEAVAAGIPTICWDSDCASSKRKTFYSVSDTKLGVELAQQLLIACGGKLAAGDTIGIISGQASAPNLQARVKGVMSVLQAQAGIKVLPTLFCDDKADKAVQQIATTMSAHPDLRGWVMVGGWPLFAANALDSIRDPKRTVVICTDALEPQWQYLEHGQCRVLVAQRPFSYGEESIKILDNLRTGKKTDYPPVQEAPFDLVYKEAGSEEKTRAEKAGIKAYSLAEYQQQWKEWNSGS
jgi:ribose transport system substrate-binding protein